MRGARPATQRLERADRGERGPERFGRDLHRAGDGWELIRYRFKVFEPAKAASRLRHARPRPLENPLVGRVPDPQPNDPAERMAMHRRVDHVVHGADQPLGPREPDGEVLQPVRRGHHHRKADPVDLHRDRRLDRDLALDDLCRRVRAQLTKRDRPGEILPIRGFGTNGLRHDCHGIFQGLPLIGSIYMMTIG